MINTLRCYTDTFYELLLIAAGVLIGSAVGYMVFEDHGWWDSLWWAIVTGATVGYGDEYPTTGPGRVVGGLLIAFCVLFLVPMITARIASHLIVDNNAFTHEEQEQIKDDLAWIRNYLNPERPRNSFPLSGVADKMTIDEFETRYADRMTKQTEGPRGPI